jgi:shikimate dehydrogenase
MAERGVEIERYALVGYPVGHSRSPLIHQLFARQTGSRISYELIEADDSQLETAVLGFKAAGGKGMNVTVPHKEAAFVMATETGKAAEVARAVNTLSFSGKGIRGDNTDGVGFIRDLTVNQSQQIEGERVLILGAGGAARGILGPLLDARPESLTIANRTTARAQMLSQDFGGSGTVRVCRFDDLRELGAFSVVINATSAGLHGEQPPFPRSLVTARSFCYDLAYSLKQTPFVGWARENGAGRAVQGWGMLVEQAAESFAIWRGVRPDTAPILQQLAS